MGDVVSLVERAQEQFDEEEAEESKEKSPKRIWFDDFPKPKSTGEENG
jgi:signal recognition particle GTPase